MGFRESGNLLSTPNTWLWLLSFVFLAGSAASYARGWRRLRFALPGLANRLRMLAFGLGVLMLTWGLLWPLPLWSNYLLSMRSAQKVLICMLAPPLLWLSCPFHIGVWGLPFWARRGVTRQLKAGRAAHRSLRLLTQPGICWLTFVGAFMLWHDPAIAQWTLANGMAHTLAPWLIFLAALLFWLHIIPTGPRLYTPLPAWGVIAYLLAVEIPNMVAGITIAFTAHPLYPIYTVLRSALPAGGVNLPVTVLEDQMVAGAVIWVTGSMVYVSSILIVLSRLFAREGAATPQPACDWDADEKLIAPGLEHRAAQNRLRNVDLSHQ
jgi:cytochrome c oxidase assembly factor CtaG